MRLLALPRLLSCVLPILLGAASAPACAQSAFPGFPATRPVAASARGGEQAVRHLQALRRIALLANTGNGPQAVREAEALLAEDRQRGQDPTPALALRWRFQSMTAAAQLHEQLGHDERAIALYREVLDSFGERDTDFAPRALMESVVALDRLCARSGQPGIAVPYLSAFLAQPAMQSPANLFSRIGIAGRLGKAALEARRWDTAETALLQALDGMEKSAGEIVPVGIGGTSPDTARFGPLSALANANQRMKEQLAALSLLQTISDTQGRQVLPRDAGAGWLEVDTPAANLARLYHLQGRHDALERFYRGPFAAYAARIRSVPQPEGYADLEKEYARLGLYLGAAGKWQEAGEALDQARRLNNLWLQAYTAAALPALQRQTFARRRALRDMILSWHLRTGSTAAQRQALLGDILQDKAMEREVLARRAHAIRRSADPEVRRLQEQIDAIDGPASTENFVLQMNLEQALQARVAAAIAPLRFEPGQRFVERVRRALDGATLVSITVWRPFDFGKQAFGEQHYLGAVLDARGARIADLGPIAAIDPLLGVLRTELSTAPGAGPDRAAQALKAARAAYDALLAPLLGARAPDGSYLAELDGTAAQVPLEALADGGGRYLVEAGTWRYLASARVLVEPAPPSTAGNRAEIIVDADYDARPAGQPRAAASGSRLEALQALRFQPLPATLDEGRVVAAALERGGARTVLHSGTDAGVAALRGVRAPRWLHVATHGFYLEEAGIAREQVRGNDGKDYLVERYAPDLGSGLALAGANPALAEGAGRGLLFAADLQRLDLEGTELVVLSACDSARGAVAIGEAVDSLRQAIEVAGARASLTSLWSVPDGGTRELMTGFYGGLADGAGKAAALRGAKLAAKARRPHPFYWAPFILSGAD